MTEKDYSAIPSIDKAIEVRVAGRKTFIAITALERDSDGEVQEMVGSTFNKIQACQLVKALQIALAEMN
ncbi:MAG: hypothetical protein ACTH54_03240 [Vagococcus salmoninarum]|uniref:hypothetical protein n=1 Tax=Vagococcus salmoninarum TaxID=2739 RepID=UPI003F99149D